MRRSPPFSLHATPPRAWRVLVRAAGIGSAATCLAWGMAWWPSLDGPASRAAVMAVALALAVLAMGAARSLARAPGGVLRWDGDAWWFAPHPAGASAMATRGFTSRGGPAQVALALDAGGWLLLRVLPVAGEPRWLPLRRADALTVWHPLRSALYSVSPAPVREAADPP